MAKKKPIILWKDGRASLYCRFQGGNSWEVVNGGWELRLKGLVGTVVQTGAKLTFDKVTEAPKIKGGYDDYNTVMALAEKEANNG